MSNATQFVGDIPGNYDRLLGPNIFEDYAADIARRAAGLKPQRVLELAAGTGIVSRKLRDALPPDSELVVTDLNGPMLEVAKAKFRAGEKVEFSTADAMKLGWAHVSFDAIVCQFGVMFFPDKIASFREALRVLRPGGTYLFSTWADIADNAATRIANDAVARFFPDNPPGFYRVPFSYPDPGKVTADLKTAGFQTVSHEVLPLEKQVADIAGFARGLVLGNPLGPEIVSRGTVSPEDVIRDIESRMRTAFGPEPASMPLKATVFSAGRPKTTDP